MAEQSQISWTDATFNPWIGCTKVGPGCDHCYAERDNTRRKWVPGWGPGQPRRRTSDNNWRQLLKWNAAHDAFFAEHGRKRNVFAASLADIFDNEVEDGWRQDFWNYVALTQSLQYFIVTKRIGNAEKMLPPNFSKENFGHVVLIITVCNQEEWLRDGPKLKALKQKYPWLRVGLSIEPMLGPMDLSDGLAVDLLQLSIGPHWTERTGEAAWLDWVICGGESGPDARPTHPDWVRSLREQCAAANVPFHFKQWGEHVPAELIDDARSEPWRRTQDCREHWSFDEFIAVQSTLPKVLFERVGKKKAGRKLDGVEHNDFPRAV